jgi:hypothetical protein
VKITSGIRDPSAKINRLRAGFVWLAADEPSQK